MQKSTQRNALAIFLVLLVSFTAQKGMFDSNYDSLATITDDLALNDDPTINYEFYTGSVAINEGKTQMTRIALGYLGESKTLYRITFSRLNTVNLSPTYEVINIDTSSNDLTKSDKGFLGSSVDVLKNISDFPPVYPVGAKYFRLVRMEWTVDPSNTEVPTLLVIRMSNDSVYKLNVKSKA